MIPLAKTSIITVILFQFLSFWNEYIIAFTLMDENSTLAVGLKNLMAVERTATNYGIMYAGLVIVMIPVLILYVCVQKQLTKGMTLGGLKGLEEMRMSNVVRNVSLIIVFFVCLALIFVGQKNISATGLCMELAGLAGLLVLLFIYNRRYK